MNGLYNKYSKVLIMKFITNTPLDKLLDGGIENDVVTNIYGPPGTGKSNFCIASCIANEKKTIYIDTEGSFSLERFEQLDGTKEKLNSILLLEVHSWEEQNLAVKNIEKIIEKNNIGLIIIDSMVNFYRLELDNNNFPLINKQLTLQYSLLSSIARKNKIPVLITNQIYMDDHDNIELSSKTIARYWSKTLIELKKTDRENQRIALIRKHRAQPEDKKVEFEICHDGLKLLGKFNLF